MTGAYMTMRTSIIEKFWICVTSLVLRMISDDTVNLSTSAAANPDTCANKSRRRSRDAFEPRIAAMYPTATAHTVVAAA